MSAFGSKADIAYTLVNVCYWHKADMRIAAANVCFRGNSGHRDFRASCLVVIQSGHLPPNLAVPHKHSVLAVC
jgi:hypothetical protein